MERDSQDTGYELRGSYNPPPPPYESSTRALRADTPGLEPTFELGEGSDQVASWHSSSAPQDDGFEREEIPQSSIALEFTDTHVTPYTDTSGKMGSTTSAVQGQSQQQQQQQQGGTGFPSNPDFSGSQPDGRRPSSGPNNQDGRKAWFWHPRRYQGYFDVDTSDVLRRMLDSLKGPFMPNFLDKTRSNPDLYGPFWVATTVIFITAVTGNLNDYITHRKNLSEATDADEIGFWVYDIDKVSFSTVLFYGYVGVIGLLLWGLLAYYSSNLALANVWCIYGYSLTAFLPVAPLCTLPVGWLQWLLVLSATAMSALFLVLNLRAEVQRAMGPSAYPTLLAVLGLHLALGLSLKLFFFKF